MGGKSKHTHNGVGDEPAKLNAKGASLDPQYALLVGFVHLLGLFFTHSRSSFKARATSVLFDQLLRHMNLLGKNTSHDGQIMIRRMGRRFPAKHCPPNYHISLGPLAINGMGSAFPVKRGGNGSQIRMDSALGQSFECLAAHGIDSMLMKFPGTASDKIDKLRLSLNIIARFRTAVEDSTTIVFRYYGRSMRVPLIYDNLGRPDPNLTLMAGLNSLSAVNARELVKQADKYRTRALVEGINFDNTAAYESSYELIFKAASLSSQIIRPLVEINSLPWVIEDSAAPQADHDAPLPSDTYYLPNDDDSIDRRVDPRFAWRSFSVDRFREPISYRFFSGLLDVNQRQIASNVDAIIADDFDSMEIQDAGQRLVKATTLLKAIETQNRDPLVIDRVIHHLQNQFLWVPESVLTKITVQRKGIKLHDRGGALMVGMIHPRLLNMIALVKSAVVNRQKMRMAENISFAFNYPNINMLAKRFGIESTHALHLLGLLKGTIGSAGRFNLPLFNAQADDMMRYGDNLFEIYFCMLKQLPRFEDRLLLLSAFTRLTSRLEKATPALEFVLDGIFRPGSQIDYSDRNALMLANRLLCASSATLSADMERTPEEVLLEHSELNPVAHRYAAWRLMADKVYIGIKLEKIQLAILQSLVTSSDDMSMPASFLLALEREAIIFLSLIGGGAARTYMRRALLRYSDPQSEIYQKNPKNPYFGPLMYHLRTIIIGIGHMGNSKDRMSLRLLRRNIDRLSAINNNAAYTQQAGRVASSIDLAVQSIQATNEKSN